MRTTIDFSDDMFRHLKAMAAMKGITIKQFLHKAVEHELSRSETSHVADNKVKFPILDSKEPGTLHLTNAEIDDLLT